MKPDNRNRFAAGLLAILFCLCSFSMPAFASGTDPAPEPLPEIIEEEPTTGGMEPEGVPITPKGNATLVDDFYGDKQLITVTTKAGNYFYILIGNFIAKQMGMSRASLYNKTKGMMDIGISEYIIKCRLEYARKLLDATTLSISEAAEQSGFKHSRNFSTVFKNAMGMSPSDYRKKDSRPS